MHMAQQMPLPLTISCSSKSRLVLPSWFLPFWYLAAHPGGPRQIPEGYVRFTLDVCNAGEHVTTLSSCGCTRGLPMYGHLADPHPVYSNLLATGLHRVPSCTKPTVDAVMATSTSQDTCCFDVEDASTTRDPACASAASRRHCRHHPYQ